MPLFLRVSKETLQDRRIRRSGYHTAGTVDVFGRFQLLNTQVQFNAEGSFWQDPPGYWENIVYPAYLKAHADMFIDENVESGESAGKVPGLVVIDGERCDMAGIFDKACQAVEERLRDVR